MLPDRDLLVAFWEEQVQVQSPRLVNNPMCAVPDWKSKFIPLFIHGDGAGRGKSWQKSMDSFSWGSLMSRGATKIVSLLICCIFALSKVKGFAVPQGSTMNAVFERMRMSFTALFHGTWPGTRRLLAGGYRAVVYVLQGDLDYLAKDLGLPHYSACDCCFPARLLLHVAFWWFKSEGAGLSSKHKFTGFGFLVNAIISQVRGALQISLLFLGGISSLELNGCRCYTLRILD